MKSYPLALSAALLISLSACNEASASGKTDGSMGMTIQEFADYIAYLFPDCILAYNLDGGGSTNVVLKGERIHTTPGHRQISDILYFASAWQED